MMSFKDYYRIYPPLRIWRMLWLVCAKFPMLPQTRVFFLRMGGVHIKNSSIYGGVTFDTVYPQGIFIGTGVRITTGSRIMTHYVDTSRPGIDFVLGEVHIEDGVFIGMNTCICRPVTIGEGSVVGAGSIVTKDIPPFQVWGGNPARYIKDKVH